MLPMKSFAANQHNLPKRQVYNFEAQHYYLPLLLLKNSVIYCTVSDHFLEQIVLHGSDNPPLPPPDLPQCGNARR